MATFSSLRARRLAAQAVETIHPAIAFPLRQCWFALTVEAVQKVLPLGDLYGDPHGTGICLTPYQGRELLAIDVGYRIFGEAPTPNLWEGNQAEQRYLVVVQNRVGELVGLPIDGVPAVCRVSESAFVPIPKSYLATGNIRCLSSTMIQLPARPPLFLLDPEKLHH